MLQGKVNKATLWREGKDYAMITIAMLSYCIGWSVFLLPNNITTGGVPGISSILEWSPLAIPAQLSYFVINAVLLLIALRILGWKFCVKTVYGVVVLTVALSLTRESTASLHLLHDQPFMAAVLGAVLWKRRWIGFVVEWLYGRHRHRGGYHQQISGHLAGAGYPDLRRGHHFEQLFCAEGLGARDLWLRGALHHGVLYRPSGEFHAA